MKTLAALHSAFAQAGIVQWLGVRPARREAMLVVDAVDARAGRGLVGDRYNSRNGKRQITLIQAEHLPVIAALLGRESVAPEQLRRNIIVSGINLLALKDKRFRVGAVECEGTGLAHPCSRMEEVLGEGGYNAVRGHGGITARIHTSGIVRLGDAVSAIQLID